MIHDFTSEMFHQPLVEALIFGIYLNSKWPPVKLSLGLKKEASKISMAAGATKVIIPTRNPITLNSFRETKADLSVLNWDLDMVAGSPDGKFIHGRKRTIIGHHHIVSVTTISIIYSYSIFKCKRPTSLGGSHHKFQRTLFENIVTTVINLLLSMTQLKKTKFDTSNFYLNNLHPLKKWSFNEKRTYCTTTRLLSINLCRTYIQCNSLDFDDLYMVINLFSTKHHVRWLKECKILFQTMSSRALHNYWKRNSSRLPQQHENNQMFIVEIPNNAIGAEK